MYFCKILIMEIQVAQIAALIAAEVVGNENAIINSVGKIEEGNPGELTFLANPKYTQYIYTTQATAVLVSSDFVPEKPISTTLIKTDNVLVAFAKLLEFYQSTQKAKSGISERAAIDSTVQMGENVYIGHFAVIEEGAKIGNNVAIYPNTYIGSQAVIGDNTTIYAGVNIYSQSVIGAHCTIHSGAVIGADGFGFAPEGEEYVKIPQIGNVVIEDGVEIGANTCIDRATLGSTIIRKNVKLDNLVQVAHNVEIGESTAFASQVGVSGSTKIGRNCIFAGQVGVAGHLKIGDKVIIGAQSGVSKGIGDNQIMLGSPAVPVVEEKKLIIYRKKLPQLFQQVSNLEKDLKIIIDK